MNTTKLILLDSLLQKKWHHDYCIAIMNTTKQVGICCLLTKQFTYASTTTFISTKKKIFFCKIFQGGPQGSKNGKLKSKKQKCLNLNFIDYVRQKIPTCKVSEITGGLNFGSPDTNFEIFGPRRPRVGHKTSKMDQARVITSILTHCIPLQSIGGGRNGEKLRFSPLQHFLGYFLGMTESSFSFSTLRHLCNLEIQS